MASILPRAGKPKSSGRLDTCALGINYVLSLGGSLLENDKQCCFIVIPFLRFKVKWITKAVAQITVQWYFTLQWCIYSASAHLLKVFLFVLGQSIVSCSQASRLGGGKQSGLVIWTGLLLIVVHVLKLSYMPFNECRWISYSVVNLIWVIVVCVCLSWSSNMYMWEAGYDEFFLSGALSFMTVVTP